MKKFSCTIGFLVLLISCTKRQKNQDCERPGTVTIEVKNCKQVLVANQNLSLCFDALLSDSRCPVNAVCVWQGMAVARFTLNTAGNSHQLTLSTTKMAGFPSPDTTVAGYKVQLKDIIPYPGAPPQPVQAEVTVSQ